MRRPLITLFFACLATSAIARDLEPSAASHLRMNDLQAIGTHNSYKVAIPPAELAMIATRSEQAARALDYGHLPLKDQLDLGMRQLEIDVLYDPDGGRYARPRLPQLSGVAYDATGMDKPGYKVLHMPDADVRSQCATFVLCLKQVKAWSDAHPKHVPILIMMNAKDGKSTVDGGTNALDYDAKAFDALDGEIRSVFGPDRLITPDDVRGNHKTLRDGVLASGPKSGWPTLEAARGKVFFALDEGPAKVAVYMRDHTSLEGLPVFVNSLSETADHAAYFTMNDPAKQFARIQAAVKAGFIVRTRADDSTTEARTNDLSRFEAALKSGAHYISTDYPTPRPEFGPYKVVLPDGAAARANPVRVKP
ncbi:phosphatidylinositol-specific phospholipase C1-like protein [Asticcacaulis sp. SL142]|uniref:phosphatidylinositol-specific phospholipase C1-like protein n=1 Tax=Asticcacaulis sp. SL142 TaxID=2995155 RepID=UPI00226C685F|nr:phosphatidylinositol-specific phospholipase C1-like protein [Asticcacaulis sp. SL142]WAC48468.1 phosphatidylinositol-specific phospholipase C1-like protein [Asticcacaulis sp. SL142]